MSVKVTKCYQTLLKYQRSYTHFSLQYFSSYFLPLRKVPLASKHQALHIFLCLKILFACSTVLRVHHYWSEFAVSIRHAACQGRRSRTLGSTGPETQVTLCHEVRPLTFDPSSFTGSFYIDRMYSTMPL